MLSRLILPTVAAVLLFAACRHEVEVEPTPTPPTTTPTPIPTPTPTFGISGDTAVEVMQARSVDATILLADSGAGLPPAQNFSVSGLPPNVFANFTRTVATPPDQIILRITAGPRVGLNGTPVAAPGTFIATVRARLNNGAEKTHSVRVTVMANPNCAELKVGTYSTSGCGGGFPVYATYDTAHPNRIYLANFPSAHDNTYAELNCASNTLMVPRMNVGLLNYFSATATFTQDTITGIGYEYAGGSLSPTDSCNFIIRR